MDPVIDALHVDVERTRARIPASLSCLADVVWNMAWTWLPDGEATFREMDATLWEGSAHNARAMLEQINPRRLAELAADPSFVARARALKARLDEYLARPPAPEAEHLRSRYDGKRAAYFCAEFGVHESLPIYSGGLGILAGDHLKSASDLGLPLLAVGLRYQQGYFYQGLDQNGWQVEYYRDTDFGALPVGLILAEDGTPRTVEVPFHGRTVTLQLWAVRVGCIPLLLLDSNREDNDPVDRWLTGHLYGGDRDTRLGQEMLLGIGGIRALRALGYDPAVFHMNEGHAAFLGLELIREELERGRSWDEALDVTRKRSVFTTHTPVPAGHDTFSPDRVATFMGDYLAEFREGGNLIAEEQVLGLARKYREDRYEVVNMTLLAIHTSRSINGVSRLHGDVSRRMFHWLWPDKGVDDAPITHVTNGVHAGTWVAPLLHELLDRYLGPGWQRRQSAAATWEAIDAIPDAELWEAHCQLKRRLVQYTREKARRLREQSGESQDYIESASQLLDPEALTIGFARRVATYKRLDLLLHDPDRALGLLNTPGRPAQFIISGKAHPHDSEAKRLVQFLFRVRRDPRVVRRATFLADYNIAVARQLVQGVDVWLNLPRRPLEASGTSGMKAAMNGALNCSVLDGWWEEAYNGRNGWAVGSTEEFADTRVQDEQDAESLYSTLEQKVIPLFYQRD
ncbi:MAG: putative alpha-glucan phosphorylase, partial [Armatimonadetes bacterium]|nr:putative alpha-glucan phosphorylase [Armatimonadota bacterium]